MRALFLFLVFCTTFAYADSYIPNSLEGKVKDIFVGELDPFVGDYCVITIRDERTGILYGFISDEGPSGAICDDADSIEKGWRVGAQPRHLEILSDSDLIGALHHYAKFVFKNERVFFMKYNDHLTYLDDNY